MKHLTVKLLSLFLLLAGLGFITACQDEDPSYPMTVVVKFDSDTMKTVPHAYVTVYQVLLGNDPNPSSAVNLLDSTDNFGECHFEMKYEAIHKVSATIDTGSGPMYGETNIRLRADETVVRSIFIK